MRILVTGGAGFIGSHLVQALLDRGDTVVCLDNFNDYYDPRRKRLNVAPFLCNERFTLAEGDVRDSGLLTSVAETHDLDAVMHLAAMAGVRPSLRNPELYQDVNVGGTTRLLEMCRSHGIPKFVFASSSSVYGANQKVPFSEDDPVDHPVSPYGATKRAKELLAYVYHHLYGMTCVGLRFFTAYGPRGRPDMAPYLFTQRIINGEPITVYGDGSSTRDYTYVGDIVAGVVSAIDRASGYEILNVGNSVTVRLDRLIQIIEELAGRKAIIQRWPPQAGDLPATSADITRARRYLDYDPKVSIEEGMARFVAWYRAEVMAERIPGR